MARLPIERLRLPLAAVALALLLGVMASWGQRSARLEYGFRACVDAPAACEGVERVLNLHRVIAVADGHYTLQGERDIEVRGPTRGLTTDQTVTVGVRFDGDLGLVERWRVHHRRRWAKYALGLAGMVFLLLALPFWFRWRHGRVVLRG